MSLIYAGIDEAAYGPLLGPLCVGLSVFRVRTWTPGDSAPDLWSMLRKGVCKKPGDKRGRIPIADSKLLKLANDTRTRHPLTHLERGVLAGLAQLGRPAASDTDLHTSLGARLDTQAWYGGPPLPLPVGCAAGAPAIAANVLGGALAAAEVELLDARCEIIGEDAFNEVVRRTGSKGAATLIGVGRHLRHVLGRWGSQDGEPVRIVCDRLGGRTNYAPVLLDECPGATVDAIEESPARCRYSLRGPADAVVQFMPEAESAHLPVALASMIAKYVRELAMARFNRYWCALDPSLKPTAGYSTDARRWLADAAGILTRECREAMVRIA